MVNLQELEPEEGAIKKKQKFKRQLPCRRDVIF
jgi:hypothetical protein